MTLGGVRSFILVASICIVCVWMPARASITLSLPAPSNPATIGSVSLHLIDSARWDPFAPTHAHRSLMVTLWYPALKSTVPTAKYLDGVVAHVVDGELDVAAGTFESAHSHARSAATVAARGGRGYPVILYSPGFGSWRNASTALTEELVSHGFVVVTIDHPYDAAAVEFPNHAIVKSRPPVVPGDTKALTYSVWYAMVTPLLAVRIADARFVIDQLAELNAGRNPDVERRRLPEHLAGALDLDRIGMFGHSLGGTTTAQVVRADTRIRAGLSLDGPIPAAKGTACSLQPMMLVRSADPVMEQFTVPSWRTATRTLCGWHLAVMLHGSGHNDFTDLTIFARQLGLGQRQRATWSLGSIDAAKAVDAERTYVVNFFERWLDSGPNGRAH
jgi:dienelactone hydrolase